MNMIKMIKMGSCFFLLHLNHKIKFLSEADDTTDFIWFWGRYSWGCTPAEPLSVWNPEPV